MEFNAKLHELRKGRGLTQEELAAALYVSRTAVSKWESGRGYPGIDSLKAIAAYFNVTVDDLICSGEMINLAEEDKKAARRKNAAFTCGIIDCLSLLIFIMPLFAGNGLDGAVAVSLWGLSGINHLVKILFVLITAVMVLWGICSLLLVKKGVLTHFKAVVAAGLVPSVVATAVFVLARQPYAGIFCFCLLIIKGFFLINE